MQNRNIIFGAIFLVLAFLPRAHAVSPPPDGCYPNFTTAEGCNALKFLTSGVGNTGLGAFALYQNSDAGSNTGIGNAVQIWDLSTNAISARYQHGTNVLIDAAAWSPDGRYLATGGEDKRLCIWQVPREGGEGVSKT